MNPIDRRVGSKIRARRLELRLTQEEVSRDIGVSFQQLQKYERGINRVSASRVYLLAKILAVKPEYFFDEGPDDADAARVDVEVAIGQSEDGRRLNEAFLKIKSKPTRRSIIELIENIARHGDG